MPFSIYTYLYIISIYNISHFHTAMKIGVHRSFQISILCSADKYPEVKLLDHIAVRTLLNIGFWTATTNQYM